MPGRLTPPMPERLSPQWAMSALTSVPAVMAGGRMDDEAGRLVDDDEVVVLVDDGERDRLAPRLGRRRGRDFEHDLGARLHPRRGLADHRARRP